MREGDEVNLESGPTKIDLVSNRNVVLLIFQATNATGKCCAIGHVMSGGKSGSGLASVRCLSLKLRPFV